MKESYVEKQVNEFAKAQGIATLKLTGPGDRGKADRLYMLNGKAVFVEFKAPGKEPTDLQFRFLNRVRENGFSSNWFDNGPEAIAWLKQEFNLD